MKRVTQLCFATLFGIFILLLTSCKKDSVSNYESATVNMKVYNDNTIALPITVVAGNNCLLSAYNTSAGQLKFNLTDNDGKLIWQKEFGIKSISKILYEADGTFTIFPGDQRLINIDNEGMVLRDDPAFMDSLYTSSLIFNAFIDNSNNYILTGMFSISPVGRNCAFATAYSHDGTFLFQKNYIDTPPAFHTVVIGNYSAITGGEQMDDGGYMFFGNAYYDYSTLYSKQIRFNIIRTDKTGNIIWQNNNLLIDSAFVTHTIYQPPFSNQLPFSTDIYGFQNESFTNEIIRTADGNFLCFLNLPDYLASDQRARVYKIDPNGNLIDSLYINFERYNRFMGGLSNYFKISGSEKSYSCGNAVVRNADNTFSMCMQNGFFGSKGLTNSYAGESRSFVVRIDQNLNILDNHFIENYYTDCFTSACRSSDGRTVYFGIISSLGNQYKPVLIFNDN